MNNPVIKVEHLKKYYTMKKGPFSQGSTIRACDDVSFEVKEGETLAIVGESGCGKTTTVQSVIRLIEPTDGSVFLDGEDFLQMKGKKLKEARQKIKLIFQDPYSSLNPRMTVRDIIAEPLDIAGVCKDKAERDTRVLEVCGQVGLNEAFLGRYPHEFSGGQRQRIGIARAIILKPKVVICDEPVSALDVSVQAKIINLLRKFQKEMGLSYIFISHDLSVVHHIADRVLVMYLGRVVEEGTTDDIYKETLHPYSKILLESVPRTDRDNEVQGLSGSIPSPADIPSGCPFHTRCPYAKEICTNEVPKLKAYEGEHKCACHFAETLKERK